METRSSHTKTPAANSNRPLRDPAGLVTRSRFSIENGDLLWLDGHWYVSHSGLIRLARRSHCAGIHVEPVSEFSDPTTSKWAFKATVYKSRTCRGFVGYGDANPSNVSSLVQGAEMRVAETRAVNRALRKAYGIGICSVEEIGQFQTPTRRFLFRIRTLIGIPVASRFETTSARSFASTSSTPNS